MRIKLLLISHALCVVIYSQKIFPGAVGYGTDSRGAYGSSVTPRILTVNTLDDGYYSTGENSGTFSWCLGQNYPRIVVFEVGGVIDYTGGTFTIYIRNPYISIYGQTAPQPGIIIKTAYIVVETHDVLIQHLKLRIGDEPEGPDPSSRDCILVTTGSDNVVLDHCSFAWSVDESVGIALSEPCNLTVSNCLIAESLFRSIHCESDHPEQHNLAFLVAGYSPGINITSYRNIITKTRGRNPRINCENAILINNLIYGQGGLADLRSPGGDFSHISAIGNDVIYLQNVYTNQTASQYAIYVSNTFGNTSSLYVEDNNCYYKQTHPSASQWDLVQNNERIPHASTSPHDLSSYEILSVTEVEDYLTENCGAFYWERDYVDELIIQELTNRDTFFIDSPDTLPARASVQDQTLIYYDYGDMENGYDWSTNNETLVVNGQSITLDQNCTDVESVIDYLNSVLPAGVECVRMNGYKDLNWVRLQTIEVGPSTTLTLSGDALLTLGRIPAGTYYGVNGKGYGFTPTSRLLNIPDNPHGDDNGNGYTNFEEWVFNMSFAGDINHAPIVENASVTIPDSLQNGELIHTVVATDPDEGQTLTFTIIGGNSGNIFSIDPVKGEITISNSSQLENYDNVSLIVRVTDDGEPSLSAEGIISVTIIHQGNPENEPPVIHGMNTSIVVDEDQSRQIVIGDINVTDPDDPPEDLTVILIAGANYSVNGATLIPASNFFGNLSVVLYVRDDDGAESNHFTTTVVVNPVNDPPVVSNIPDQTISPGENFNPTNLNNYVTDIETSDANINWTYTGNSALSVSIINGIATITKNDEDWTGSETITFTASDDDTSPLTDSDEATFTVTTTNYPPSIDNQEFHISASAPSSTIGYVEASDPNTNQQISFSIISGNDDNYFALNGSTGELNLIDVEIFNEQLYEVISLEIEVTDNGSPQYSDQAEILIHVHEFDNSVYIDPDHETGISDGSLQYPFNSWDEITWEPGNYYLQKRNTVANENSIVIDNDNVYLGAYGYGNSPEIQTQSDEYAIYCSDKKNVSINNLKIVAEESIAALYFVGSNNDSITINKCDITGGDYGIRIIGGINYTVCYNKISGNPYGLYSLANSTIIYYNLFHENIIGMEVTNHSSNVRVYNNVFAENIQSIFSTNSGLILYNNIFDLNLPGSVALVQQDENYISDYNLFYPVSSGFVEIAGQAYNDLAEYSSITRKDLYSIGEDPMFIDKETGNYRIESNSPAINAGVDIGLSSDLYGHEVPIGTYPDIGVAESEAGSNAGIDPANSAGDITFDLYPNPSRDYIWVSYSSLTNNSATLRILDPIGRVLYLDEIEAGYYGRIDLSEFPSGMYTVQLFTQSSVVNRKLVFKH